MSFFTLSINFTGHDSSVALFDEDELIFFHQAERYTRQKHAGNFNTQPFVYIFQNITKKIDLFVFREDLYTHRELRKQLINNFEIKHQVILQSLPNEQKHLFKKFNLKKCTHHMTHALSAFYMSPFDEAVCLVIDAIGDPFTIPNEEFLRDLDAPRGVFGYCGFESTTIFEISKNFIPKTLYKKSQVLPAILQNQSEGTISIAHLAGGVSDSKFAKEFKTDYVLDASDHMDIGNMYHTITQHLGFGFLDAGKTMGLSAYGKEDFSLPEFLIKDTIYTNNNLFSDGRTLNRKIFPELFGDLTFEKKANIAYALQKSLEKMFLYHAEFIKNNSNIKNLVIGGGCALNILGVSLIKKHYPEFNIFVDPIAHDATHAIGEGIFVYNLLRKDCKLVKKNHFKSIYLGPKYDENEYSSIIDKYIEENKNDCIE